MFFKDYNPRWVVGGSYELPGGVKCYIFNDPNHGRHGMGVSFDCPVCMPRHKLSVMFDNPVDGLPKTQEASFWWHRVGDDFNTISLSPSIDATVNTNCKFHASVINGEFVFERTI